MTATTPLRDLVTVTRARVGAPPALALAAVAMTLLGTGAKPPAKQPAAPVMTAVADLRPTPLSIYTVGSVEPIESVAVRPQVGGEIVRVAFNEGEDVRTGQLLFQIDPRPLQAALAAAQAQLARDQAQAANAEAQAARYQRLVAKDYVTKEQYDAARTQAEVFRAAAQADSAAVEQARLNLAYASVRSPVAGRAGSALVKRGNVVAANGPPLVVVNQLRPIRVSFGVPGAQLAQVQKYRGDGPLEVRVRPSRDGAGDPIVGRLTFVDNAVDPATGTVTMKAQFANDDGSLWPGQFVDAELVLAVEPQALTVPAAAVVTGQQGPFVFVVGPDQKVEQRPVTVNRTVGDRTVLDGGVRAGETVVTDGQMRLVPGTKVEVKASRSDQGRSR